MGGKLTKILSKGEEAIILQISIEYKDAQIFDLLFKESQLSFIKLESQRFIISIGSLLRLDLKLLKPLKHILIQKKIIYFIGVTQRRYLDH